MATVIQSKANNGTGTSVTCTFDSAVTVGNDIIFVVDGSTAIPTGATFDGNSMREDGSENFGLFKLYKFRATSTGTAVVGTLPSSANWKGIAIEVSGLQDAGGLDFISEWITTAESTSQTYSLDNVGKDIFALAYTAQGNSYTTTPLDGATALAVSNDEVFPETAALLYKDGLDSGPQTLSATISGSTIQSYVAFGYRNASTTYTGVTPPSRLNSIYWETISDSSTPTSASVSPAGNALIIATIFWGGEGTGPTSVSSSFSTVDDWVIATNELSANDYGTSIAYAITTASPGSGTITWTFGSSALTIRVGIEQILEGFNTSTPIGVLGGGFDTTSDPISDTFSNTPVSNSQLYGAINVRAVDNNPLTIDPTGSNWGEYARQHQTFNQRYEAHVGPGSSGSAFGWDLGAAPQETSWGAIEILSSGIVGQIPLQDVMRSSNIKLYG